MTMRIYPEASMTVQPIARPGKPDGLHVVIAAATLDELDEAIHLLNQYREEWHRTAADD